MAKSLFHSVCQGADPRVGLSCAWVIISLRHVVIEWLGAHFVVGCGWGQGARQVSEWRPGWSERSQGPWEVGCRDDKLTPQVGECALKNVLSTPQATGYRSHQ